MEVNKILYIKLYLFISLCTDTKLQIALDWLHFWMSFCYDGQNKHDFLRWTPLRVFFHVWISSKVALNIQDQKDFDSIIFFYFSLVFQFFCWLNDFLINEMLTMLQTWNTGKYLYNDFARALIPVSRHLCDRLAMTLVATKNDSNYCHNPNSTQKLGVTRKWL